MRKCIDKLIINSPYEEPKNYWHYDRETQYFSIKDGRRPAGYVVATPNSKSFDDPGVFVPIELVKAIRPRVLSWRENGYPGVTGITKRLLEHWQEPEERKDRRRARRERDRLPLPTPRDAGSDRSPGCDVRVRSRSPARSFLSSRVVRAHSMKKSCGSQPASG